jgi:hypothetical protein
MDDQGHKDLMPTLGDAKKVVKSVMWDRKTTWVTELEVPQNKANVLELTRAAYNLPCNIHQHKTGREWWVTARGGLRENEGDSNG